jgi:hypothetical protein
MPTLVRRPRLQAAARKLAASMEAQRADEADVVAVGVRATAKEIMAVIEPGSLYWRAPLQYVCEQMAPRVAKQYGLPDDALDELRAYLMAGLQEYMVALVGEFDREHFEAWSAAMIAAEQRRQSSD